MFFDFPSISILGGGASPRAERKRDFRHFEPRRSLLLVCHAERPFSPGTGSISRASFCPVAAGFAGIGRARRDLGAGGGAGDRKEFPATDQSLHLPSDKIQVICFRFFWPRPQRFCEFSSRHKVSTLSFTPQVRTPPHQHVPFYLTLFVVCMNQTCNIFCHMCTLYFYS